MIMCNYKKKGGINGNNNNKNKSKERRNNIERKVY